MSLVFYDTETTGTDTFFDQILQFAAIRTDTDLKEIDRFDIRCRLLPHIVPAPGAMRVNRMKVSQLTDPSIPSHYEMVRAMRAKLLAWSPALFLGWNSMGFDEDLVRQALYKTLHNPYLTNNNGNSRSDVMRMAQACSIFAPAALKIPTEKMAGKSSDCMSVARANGFKHDRNTTQWAMLRQRFFSAALSWKRRRKFGLPSCASAQRPPSSITSPRSACSA